MPMGRFTICGLFLDKTQPAQKARDCNNDQWIYLGEDKDKRADPCEKICTPIVIRSPAHHIAACENEANRERCESLFDRMADR